MPYKCFPLHPAQHDVYLDELINLGNPQHNIGGYVILNGKLNEKIFNEIFITAPVIFDAFKLRFDFASQDFQNHYDIDFSKIDLQSVDLTLENNPEQKAMDWMQFRFNTPFSLRIDTLPFEHVLIKLNENK